MVVGNGLVDEAGSVGEDASQGDDGGEPSTSAHIGPGRILVGAVVLVLVGLAIAISVGKLGALKERSARAAGPTGSSNLIALNPEADGRSSTSEPKAKSSELQATNEPPKEVSKSTTPPPQKLKPGEEVPNAVIEEAFRSNTFLRGLWLETEASSVNIIKAGKADAVLKHRGIEKTLLYDDLPRWLLNEVKDRYRTDGESQGLIREVDGKIYDLRDSDARWIKVTGFVIDVIDDGYLVVDEKFYKQLFHAVPQGDFEKFELALMRAIASMSVYKLRHNGFVRILTEHDRIALTVFPVGVYQYRARSTEIRRVTMYDAGMPVGPLRERCVPFKIYSSDGEQPGPEVGRTPKTDNESSISLGSGFFITSEGHFVSNYHVVEGAKSLKVNVGGDYYPAEVVKEDPKNDLAIIKVIGRRDWVPIPVISSQPVDVGIQVGTMGYPQPELQGTTPKFTKGDIASLSGIKDDPTRFQISVPVQPGNSGGPLFDSSGNVIGVIVSRLNDMTAFSVSGSIPQNVNFAVKSFYLLAMMDESMKKKLREPFPKGKDFALDAVPRIRSGIGQVINYQ